MSPMNLTKYYIFFFLTIPYISSDLEIQKVDELYRIMGGKTCEVQQFSFMISVQNSTGFHFCGGTLLNEHWVLTAAHCCVGRAVIKVVAGRDTPGEEVRWVRRAYPHPSYTDRKFGLGFIDDIALLRLQTPINDSKFISFIQIPSGYIYEDMSDFCPSLLVMGWGKLHAASTKSSPTLQCVNLPVLSEEECRSHYRPIQWVVTTGLCTYSREGKDACPGDSGGPALCWGKRLQLAIVSLGKECITPSSPAVFTRVDDYLDFIHSTMSCSKRNYQKKLRLPVLSLYIFIILFSH